LIFYGMTDIGQKRETNQDVFYTHRFSDTAGFAIVCDGMGGQNGGHIASGMTCSIVSDSLVNGRIEALSPDAVCERIVEAIGKANAEVHQKSNSDPDCKGMGTTCVLVVVLEGIAHIAHIGDSRVYLLADGELTQVTKDHSLVQELLDQGKISPDEVQNHPNKNMITRAVGINLTVAIDYLELPLAEGSKLLLCTDGLTNMVSDEQIRQVLSEEEAEPACKRLIELANQSGGVDNITVAVVE
jgi:serine/threonine protein phosphatase PrpC